MASHSILVELDGKSTLDLEGILASHGMKMPLRSLIDCVACGAAGKVFGVEHARTLAAELTRSQVRVLNVQSMLG